MVPVKLYNSHHGIKCTFFNRMCIVETPGSAQKIRIIEGSDEEIKEKLEADYDVSVKQLELSHRPIEL
jgi:hypothetical protein